MTEKKKIKRTKKGKSSNLLIRKFVRGGFFITLSFCSFFFGFLKRHSKALVIAVLFLTISLGVSYSYKYVQAKMDESDSFSDKYILEKVGALVPLPKNTTPKMVRVDDPDNLRKENLFYAKVKEGDYIIAYPKLLIIYDAVHNEIENIKESSQK